MSKIISEIYSGVGGGCRSPPHEVPSDQMVETYGSMSDALRLPMDEYGKM